MAFKVTFLCIVSCLLNARPIDTFYGTIEVQEPVLLELIDSPAMQRLKEVRQYGVDYYLNHREEYTRYDHSLGVFAVLRLKGMSLEEQIAGLLHDVSHTVFSHVGDWIFGQEHQEKGYQDQIHIAFLEKRGLGEILNKHGFSVDRMLPKEDLFPALECQLPNLCADRIDYNIQGAYHKGYITLHEAQQIVETLEFRDNRWVSHNADLMKKLVVFSLFMTQECWGGPANHVASRYLADAILRAMELGVINLEDIHFGTDPVMWETLNQQLDPQIMQNMDAVKNANAEFVLVDAHAADLLVKSKFRGIDPWIALGEECVRLTVLDPKLGESFTKTKTRVAQGWPLKLVK